MQAKFHEVTKYVILYSKIELLQSSRSLIENKIKNDQNNVIKTNLFPAT